MVIENVDDKGLGNETCAIAVIENDRNSLVRLGDYTMKAFTEWT